MTEHIVFGAPHFDNTELENVTRVLQSGWIGQGPQVDEFERQLASYLSAPEVVAVNSCTAALHLALLAAGVGPGDEVITTAFTFAATVLAIDHTGATPRIVDIDPETLNIDITATAAAMTPRTRAIVPVHFGGRPADVASLRRIADDNGLWIVEDAAHAIGGWALGERIGAASHPRTMTCFSFYPNKNLASAEGGAVSCQHPDLAAILRSSRLHGLDVDAWNRWTTRSYRPSMCSRDGFKYNWTDLQAAIALAQLEKLEGFLAIREYLASHYDRLLAGVQGVSPVSGQLDQPGERHALHLYQVLLDEGIDRDMVVDLLKARGIGVAVHYIGLNQHPHFAERFARADLPHTDRASRSIMSLPLHPGLSTGDLERVITEIDDVIDQAVAS